MEAESIVLIAHKNPDADALGSVLALSKYLYSIKKKHICVTVGPIEKKYAFMSGIDKFKDDFSPKTHDLIISLDSGAKIMTGFDKYPEVFKKPNIVINIDHHESNNYFGSINIIDKKAPSTTYILYNIFRLLNIEITKDMASNLISGIYTDTGGFMHTNTTANSYRVASKLIQLGAEIKPIIKYIFNNRNISSLKLWGKVFCKLSINSEGIAVSAITKDDIQSCSATYNDLSGVIDYINAIPEAKYTLLLTEKENMVKGSLRTQKEYNLDQIANKLGGGGHKKAAGFAIPGRIESEVVWKIIP